MPKRALRALEESTDGFALAERDLELRGEGTIFEQRQSGRNDLKLASLARDRIWVENVSRSSYTACRRARLVR